MKTICFTNNDLAKAMGLEVEETYEDSDGYLLKIIIAPKSVCDERDFVVKGDICYQFLAEPNLFHELSDLLGEKLTLVEPKPQLTEQEITILKGRLAEGFTKMTMTGGTIYFLSEHFSQSCCYGKTIFNFVQVCEEYSIEELLKGVGE